MAKHAVRRWIKTAFIVFNSFVVFLFLLACLIPWLNPASFWWTGFAGLALPHLIVALVFLLIFWLIAQPRMAWISLVTLLIGWRQISVIFAFHAKEQFSSNKPPDCLRIVDWNIRSFNGITSDKEAKKHIRDEIAASVINLNPDVICLQEFNNAKGAQANNISLFSDAYPYHYFSKDYSRNKNLYESGCIIFSRFRLIDSGRIAFPSAESLVYADIVKEKDTIRIYTTHLQSFKFRKEDYDDMEKIRQQEEDALPASKNIFQKMRLAFRRRGAQASIVRNETDKSPYPSVICGDFNDVPASYAYFHIKGTRKDAFLEKGFGIGRSFVSLASTLRIDYILPDNRFNVVQFDMVDEGLSDHIMLVSDLRLTK